MTRPSTRAKQIELMADHLLTYLALSEITGRVGREAVSTRDFSGAQPLLTEYMTDEELEDGFVFTDARPTDLPKPLNIALISHDEEVEGGFSLQRHRAVTAKDVRGELRRQWPFLVKSHFGWIDGSGSGTGLTSVHGSGDGLKWQLASNHLNPNTGNMERISDCIRLSHGLAFANQFQWMVRIGWIGSPSISIPTDPIGARAVFRMRDMPEGRQRRAALKHWVTEHWRQSRVDANEERLVREHLRGKERFVWNGFICEIVPSHDDRVREQDARARRKELRESGEDRRLVMA